MMKVLSCIIVEDDPMAAALLEGYIKNENQLQLIGTQPDSLMASIYIQRHKPDIVFLDIQISGLDGPEMISLLDHKPRIVITSSFNKNTYINNEINIIDFLAKPILQNRFHEAVKKCLRKVNEPTRMEQTEHR